MKASDLAAFGRGVGAGVRSVVRRGVSAAVGAGGGVAGLIAAGCQTAEQHDNCQHETEELHHFFSFSFTSLCV